jgi:hypothetical protein
MSVVSYELLLNGNSLNKAFITGTKIRKHFGKKAGIQNFTKI